MKGYKLIILVIIISWLGNSLKTGGKIDDKIQHKNKQKEKESNSQLESNLSVQQQEDDQGEQQQSALTIKPMHGKSNQNQKKNKKSLVIKPAQNNDKNKKKTKNLRHKDEQQDTQQSLQNGQQAAQQTQQQEQNKKNKKNKHKQKSKKHKKKHHGSKLEDDDEQQNKQSQSYSKTLFFSVLIYGFVAVLIILVVKFKAAQSYAAKILDRIIQATWYKIAHQFFNRKKGYSLSKQQQEKQYDNQQNRGQQIDYDDKVSYGYNQKQGRDLFWQKKSVQGI